MKILIINDDPSIADLLKLMFNPLEASIRCASGNNEGLNLLNEFAPDIVLIDLTTSETNSCQVTSEIRKTSRVPILILSVIDNPITVARDLDAGADDFLIKPVPREVLVAHINNLTRRKDVNRHPSQVSSAIQSAYK